MIADEDNPLDADHASGEAASGQPKVIVIYRRRGIPLLLIPPLLLLSAVVAIVGYRRIEPLEFPSIAPNSASVSAGDSPESNTKHDREQPPPIVATVYQSPEDLAKGVTRETQISRYPAPDDSVRPSIPDEPMPRTSAIELPPAEEATIPVEEPQKPEVAAPVPSVTNPTPVAPTPLPPTIARPPDQADPASPGMVAVPIGEVPIGEVPIQPPAKRDVVGFDPEAAKIVANELAGGKPKAEANLPATPDPNPDAAPVAGGRAANEAMLEEMQRAAEKRLAERAGLPAGDGPDLLNPDPEAVKQKRHQLYAASRKLAAKDRVPFYEDLRRLVSERGNRAGPDIQLLCNRYGRDTMPEIHGAMNRDLRGASSRLSASARIERMRFWGVPEAIILDDLVEAQHHNIKGRSGPRDETEAWVFAARTLLANPPTKQTARPKPASPNAR